MKEKTNSKAGGAEIHNARMAKGLKVKTRIKAGGLRMNHNERLMGDSAAGL